MVCIFQGLSGTQRMLSYIIPGWEIPKWFEKVSICDTLVAYSYRLGPARTYKIIKVKIQLPWSVLGFDEWWGVVLCVVFLPTERHVDTLDPFIAVRGLVCLDDFQNAETHPDCWSEYGKVELHHLWLLTVSKHRFHLPKTPGCSIDKKGFHQVELKILATQGLEVEKIGFSVIQ